MGEVAQLPGGRRKSVLRAAKDSRLELLKALRDKISGDIDAGVPARDLASLSRRLMELAKDIEALQADDKSDGVSTAAATPDAPWSG